MEIKCPSDSRLVFEAEYHPAEKSTGEWQFSLGSPPSPAYYEITAVAFNNGEETVDITDFVIEHADNLLPKWEEELNNQ